VTNCDKYDIFLKAEPETNNEIVMETNAAKIRGISDHLFLQPIFCHIKDGDRQNTKIKTATKIKYILNLKLNQ
jgi:hypothetical protein